MAEVEQVFYYMHKNILLCFTWNKGKQSFGYSKTKVLRDWKIVIYIYIYKPLILFLVQM